MSLGARSGLAFALGAFSACAGGPHAQGKEESCRRGPVTAVVDIDGSCAPLPGDDPALELDLEDAGRAHSPRPLLPASEYTVRLQVQPSASGYARLRSRLFFGANDERNVLGRIPTCTVIMAAGPMKNGSGSMGIGYALRVRDRNGLTCQAYVSETVVAVIEDADAPPL